MSGFAATGFRFVGDPVRHVPTRPIRLRHSTCGSREFRRANSRGGLEAIRIQADGSGFHGRSRLDQIARIVRRGLFVGALRRECGADLADNEAVSGFHRSRLMSDAAGLRNPSSRSEGSIPRVERIETRGRRAFRSGSRQAVDAGRHYRNRRTRSGIYVDHGALLHHRVDVFHLSVRNGDAADGPVRPPEI